MLVVCKAAGASSCCGCACHRPCAPAVTASAVLAGHRSAWGWGWPAAAAGCWLEDATHCCTIVGFSIKLCVGKGLGNHHTRHEALRIWFPGKAVSQVFSWAHQGTASTVECPIYRGITTRLLHHRLWPFVIVIYSTRCAAHHGTRTIIPQFCPPPAAYRPAKAISTNSKLCFCRCKFTCNTPSLAPSPPSLSFLGPPKTVAFHLIDRYNADEAAVRLLSCARALQACRGDTHQGNCRSTPPAGPDQGADQAST